MYIYIYIREICYKLSPLLRTSDDDHHHHYHHQTTTIRHVHNIHIHTAGLRPTHSLSFVFSSLIGSRAKPLFLSICIYRYLYYACLYARVYISDVHL